MLTPEQQAKLIVCAVIIAGFALWAISSATWRSRKDEHRERCRKSYHTLQQIIKRAKPSQAGFLEDQIDDFYAEYITLVDFKTVRKYAGDLHAQLFNRLMEQRPPHLQQVFFTE